MFTPWKLSLVMSRYGCIVFDRRPPHGRVPTLPMIREQGGCPLEARAPKYLNYAFKRGHCPILSKIKRGGEICEKSSPLLHQYFLMESTILSFLFMITIAENSTCNPRKRTTLIRLPPAMHFRIRYFTVVQLQG